jgi:CRISPR/Cas system Type II protein with McrA/HNH and RuvC-like nuclease domain
MAWRYEEPKKRIVNCKHCGKEFVKESGGQKYCSLECSAAVNHAYGRGRFMIFARDNFTCIYCGKSSVRDHAELHVDHIMPRSQGGKDIAGNLVTSCVRCNVEKGEIILSEELQAEILAEVQRRNADSGISPKLNIRTGDQ